MNSFLPFWLTNPFPQLTPAASRETLLIGNCNDSRAHLAVRSEHLQQMPALGDEPDPAEITMLRSGPRGPHSAVPLDSRGMEVS